MAEPLEREAAATSPETPAAADEPTQPDPAAVAGAEEAGDETGAAPEMSSFNGEWPTHGGYLGCLMGLFMGCLLAGFIGSPLAQYIQKHGGSPGLTVAFIAGSAAIMLLGFYLFGRLGWAVGKRVYREYPAPTARDESPAPEPAGDAGERPRTA